MAKIKKTKRVASEALLFPIANKQEADDHLKRIGDLERQVQEYESEAAEQINMIKTDLESNTTPLQEQIERHRLSLEAFATNNRSKVFGKRKSIKLQFGKFGWRKGRTSIEIDDDNTLSLIKKKLKALVGQLIVTKESVDKKALGKLTDEQLAKVGAERKTTERFFAEPDMAESVDYGENKDDRS